MTNISTWRQTLPVALVLALLVVMQAGLIAQNLGTAPQVNVAVQGQTGSHSLLITRPDGLFPVFEAVAALPKAG